MRLCRFVSLTTVSAMLFLGTSGLAIGGCGGSEPKTRTVDADKVELAIAATAQTQRRLDPTVACPSGIPDHKGRSFYCVAERGATNTPFRVTELDGRGAVRFLGVSPSSVELLDTAKVAAAIRASILARRSQIASVHCPADIPRQPGLAFACIAVTPTSATLGAASPTSGAASPSATAGSKTDFIVTQTASGVTYRAR